MSTPQPLPDGHYDAVVTHSLAARLTVTPGQVTAEALAGEDAVDLLTTHLATIVRRALQGTRGDRAALARALAEAAGSSEESPEGELRRVLSVLPDVGPGSLPAYLAGPDIPLSQAALLTNAHGEATMGSQINGELGSADEVDLLCAFIKFQGLRTMEKQLARLQDLGIPFRVITTTYMGATDRRAVDQLVRDFGAQVKVHFEARSTRLHAKAWMFRRRSGFHTAYVGSSNLSRTAMLDGLEWNVRLSQSGTPQLVNKMRATFETYWNDPTFESYNPETDADRLDEALAVAGGTRSKSTVLDLSGLEHAPWPYQQEMLEALAAERGVHGRHRNLLVAATGTGKTVVAAFDYRRLAEEWGGQPTLLFVAHRRELLDQALRTYREVLGDGSFGELLTGTDDPPRRWTHVFATVQSISRHLHDQSPAAFDVVVIDEFLHASAESYETLLTLLRPRELLGLTATPERGDGFDVRRLFGGRAAHELRLWDALEADLLAPFHYFGIGDATDLRTLAFRAGRYNQRQLEGVYTGNDARSRIILQALRDKVLDLGEMRALGFCVGVEHAHYMARVFQEAGIPSRAVSGRSTAEERLSARQDLQARRVNVLFTADLYNEGVDIPQVDTVLFLRPTDSSTIFLQQLGRGLRRHPEKSVLTVLDFVGHQHADFRLDQRLAALTGFARSDLKEQVQHGFPTLPSGSQIVLDDFTQSEVLASVQRSLNLRTPAMAKELRQSRSPQLVPFAESLGVPVEQVIKNTSWTDLQRAAGHPLAPATANEPNLLSRRHAFLHVDDLPRLNAYRHWLSDAPPQYDTAPPATQRFGRMLHGLLWPNGGRATWAEGLASLTPEASTRAELLELLDVAESRIHRVARPLEGSLEASLLASHATYARPEVLMALDYVTDASVAISHREGVLWSPEFSADALLVTLNKSERIFSPSTMYRDYALNQSLFHWESQSTTSETSPTGRRYIQHEGAGTSVLLFTRRTGTDPYGKALPFTLLGTARYQSHEGSRPMAVTWELERPMPSELFIQARAVA